MYNSEDSDTLQENPISDTKSDDGDDYGQKIVFYTEESSEDSNLVFCTKSRQFLNNLLQGWKGKNNNITHYDICNENKRLVTINDKTVTYWTKRQTKSLEQDPEKTCCDNIHQTENWIYEWSRHKYETDFYNVTARNAEIAPKSRKLLETNGVIFKEEKTD